jgi:hypothetical protein
MLPPYEPPHADRAHGQSVVSIRFTHEAEKHISIFLFVDGQVAITLIFGHPIILSTRYHGTVSIASTFTNSS